jgi:hypothetical protein
MANPLFDALNRSAPQNDGGFGQMMAQLNQFRQSFRGDARAEVQRLLNSGQMTQEQFNQLSQMTNNIMRQMPKR